MSRRTSPGWPSHEAGRGTLVLNLLPITFHFNSFNVQTRRVRDGEDLRSVRESHRGDWYVYWGKGDLYMVRLSNAAPVPSDTQTAVLETDQALRLLARLITNGLVRRFPSYEPIQEHPFRFLSHKVELVNELCSSLGLTHPLLGGFQIHPKYTFDTRIIEMECNSPFVAIVVSLATHWAITADIEELVDAGIELGGLYVVRRNPNPGERRLVGRVASTSSGRVQLSESMDSLQTIASSEVMLEGRREAFGRCLRHLLGERDYSRYDSAQRHRTGHLLGGRPLLDKIRHVSTVLAESPLELGAGLTCTVGSPLSIRGATRSESVRAAKQLDYCFDASRRKRNKYAWPGLSSYGPFSQETFSRTSPRILVVCPSASEVAARSFMSKLRNGMEGKAFTVGMIETFGLTDLRFEYALVERGSATNVADDYRRTIYEALSRGDAPDSAIVIVQDEDNNLPDSENPYLLSKALLLMAGVASQEARLSTITRHPAGLQYVLQNVAVALYAKMGGIPWTVDHDLTVEDELVIGVGTAELSESRAEERQRYVGITTVFRGDGSYLVGQVSREATYLEYPTVLRDAVHNTLVQMRKRNGWQPGDKVRLIFHSARPPRCIDFASLMTEAVEAIGDKYDIEMAFLTVSQDHPLMLFDESQAGRETSNGRKGEFTPDRGLIVRTGRYSRLITTSSVTLVKGAGLPLSHPLHIHLMRGSSYCDLEYLAEQVIKFTQLSWRSTQPAPIPVTIYYSELIARLLGRMKAVPDWSPALLDTQLRTSKWFI